MAAFGTVDVYEEMGRLLNGDEEWLRHRGSKISYSMVFDYHEPVSKAFFTRFDEGRVTEVKELQSRDHIVADFIISGSADTWRGVLTNTIDPTAALTRGQLKVKGKMTALLKNMHAFKYVIDKMAEIPLD